MTEREEQCYEQGERSVWRQLYSLALDELGYTTTESPGRWVKEREDAIALLRQMCVDHGDNEWDESLHLADILEKHLWGHLASRDGQEDRPHG